jgi:Holliday junction resolvase RusA-like endonuclease
VTLRFDLPLPKNLGNARLHWRAKHRAKKAYWAELDALVLTRRLPKPPSAPLPKATVTVHFRTYNRMDRDNLVFRFKWVGDWLTTRGYIVDDDTLDWAGMPTQEINRTEQGVDVLLEEAA